ncbi:MAG: GTPase HflX [Armatimonadetes bacterium]|nr:GTPase HflX [Armatimonadota bacterium]
MTVEIRTVDRAVLVVVDPQDETEADANTEELRLLVESAGAELADEMHVRRNTPDPRFYFGKGNAEEMFLRVQESCADLVIVGEDLSPTQQRNLEEVATVRVVDRTQLILDIFAQRARTSEGKLQVELAQLQYLLPRLTGKGTQMSRIGGGSAGGIATRGPGQTKLETDRRRIRKRVAVLQDELEEVVKHRSIQNKARRQLMIPNAALVGYTSAGKSTLLNLLAGSNVEAHARLFATLDPTTRRVDLNESHSIILSDTVGFLRNLPHHLIAAFRATLEEVVEADFLIHVVDASHRFFAEQCQAVNDVLTDLGVQHKPIITVFNKSDLVANQYELRRLVAQTPDSCYMSALTGEGKEYLIRLIDQVVARLMRRIEAVIPYDRGDLLAMCHERGRVLHTDYRSDGVFVSVELSPDLERKIAQYEIRHAIEAI